MTKTLDLDSPEFTRDLYRNYATLRERDPVHFHLDAAGAACCSLFRYDHVLEALHDPRLGVARPPEEVIDGLRNRRNPHFVSLARYWANVISSQNPPSHTRLRNLLGRAFTPRVVERLRERTAQFTERLLDGVAEGDSFELVRDVAVPLPLHVMGELLGVPEEDRARLHTLGDLFHPIMDRTLWASQLRPAAGALSELFEYFGGLIRARRGGAGDDLVSGLIEARDEADALTEDEMLSTIVLLMVAGHLTTASLIGNGILALLQHPDQLSLLRTQPELTPTAVEEILRYEAPAQRTIRIALETLEIGGKSIPRGTVVDLVVGSANRDPIAFADPERLDLTRQPNRHLAFGHGIHFCLGAHLSRVEGQIAFHAILRRFPALRLASADIDWRPGSLFRGLRSLHLLT